MIRCTTVRTLLTAIAGVLVPVALAAPAQASLGIASFSVTPSTTQAGGTLTQAGPNLTIDAGFSTPDGDTPKDATIALAPGLLANPSVVPLCPTEDFNAGWCPDSSQIGAGSITGTAPEFGFTLSLPTDAYLIQPQGSEAARIGLIVTFFDYPVASQSAPVSIRTTPNVGINIPLSGLPNNLDGVPAIIDGLHLTIFGAVDGLPFTRNPTSCSSATSTLTVDSYGDPGTSASEQSSFTPSGCGSLPYTPTIVGSVTEDSGDDGIAIQATITQQYDEADDQSIELTLPFSASPRLSALADACTNSDLTTCPAVGTATVTTPLLSNSLTANIVLVAHPGALPTLAILIPQPFGIELDATPVLTGTSVRALVSDVPDIPISSLTLNLPGGANSLFRAGIHLCSEPQTFGGVFAGWNGATADPTAPGTVDGCPGSSVQRPAIAPPAGRSTPLIARGGSAPHAARISSATLSLPSGVRVDARKLARNASVRLDGRRVAASYRLRDHRLVVRFARSGAVAVITISPAAVIRSGRHGSGRLALVAIVGGKGAGRLVLRSAGR